MKKKFKYIIGIDEVGRGPLAGPITLVAIITQENFQLPITNFQLRDSKKLSTKQREEVFEILKNLKKKGEIFYSTSSARNSSIDKYGLSYCARKAIKRCLQKIIFNKIWRTLRPLAVRPPKQINQNQAMILLDGGLKAPKEFSNQKTIIKGDEKEPIIALASIIAKVTRDSHMRRKAKKFPEYNFEIHKGYGTKLHRQKIKKYGLCPIHRRTFCH